MTPDINTFVRTYTQQAREDSVAAAVKGATVEATNWLARQGGYQPGRLIWDDQWDICLVLDAVRTDQWEMEAYRYGWLPEHGDSDTEWSVGSASPEWYGNTFAPDALPEDERIGVVTANPFAGKPSDRLDYLRDATPVDSHESVVYCDYVYEESWGCEVGNGYLDVAHPSEVTNRAYDAWEEHELDRLVVHYMQPHLPFRCNPEWFGVRPDIDEIGEREKKGKYPYQTAGKDIWKRLRDGDRTRREIWDGYCDNLRWVLDDVERLVSSVDADLLVTSDHGNCMGEWGLWSHPPGVYVPAVRRVPWVHVQAQDTGPLEEVEYSAYATEDRPTGSGDVDEQLRALGYVE